MHSDTIEQHQPNIKCEVSAVLLYGVSETDSNERKALIVRVWVLSKGVLFGGHTCPAVGELWTKNGDIMA